MVTTQQEAAPAATGYSLPSSSYTSEQTLRREMTSIFELGWHCVGREDELVERGNYLCATVLSQSVIVWRGEGGQLRAFSNYCRHRGMPLLEPGSTGKAGRIACPYHAWTYDQEGQLVGAPCMRSDGSFDRQVLSLRRLPLSLWRGWIFVCVAALPMPFTPPQSGFDGLIAPFKPEAMQTVFRVQETWRTNWKLLVENFIESYHVFQVHRDTIEPRTPTSSVVCGTGDGSFCYHWLTERPGVRRHDTINEEISAELRFREVLGCVFPSHLVSVTANLLVWLSLQPVGTDAVSMIGGLAARPGYLRDGAQRREIEQQLRRDFDAFNAEDRLIVERLWSAHRSGAVQPGPLCGLEQPLSEFHRYLSGRLQ